jgi:hypothetical protein
MNPAASSRRPERTLLKSNCRNDAAQDTTASSSVRRAAAARTLPNQDCRPRTSPLSSQPASAQRVRGPDTSSQATTCAGLSRVAADGREKCRLACAFGKAAWLFGMHVRVVAWVASPDRLDVFYVGRGEADVASLVFVE